MSSTAALAWCYCYPYCAVAGLFVVCLLFGFSIARSGESDGPQRTASLALLFVGWSGLAATLGLWCIKTGRWATSWRPCRRRW